MSRRGLTRWWPLATAAGVLLALAGAGQQWAVAVAVDPVLGQTETPVTGSQVGRTITAGGLLAGAALLAALTGTRVVRLLAALSTLVAAGLVAYPALQLLWDAEPVVRSALAEATAVTGGADLALSSVRLSGWPWVALGGSLLLLAGGLAGGSRARRHGPRPSRAGELDGQARPDGGASDWDRLSEGEDPTAEGRDLSQ
ncbi:Trp biosynthesis-associated membrane protein [Ornithinicoccus halotolerans]|uniref:Trp biosynthesis-associated membrane protein n=1 Tax=Ornithinicoccus halotolerans TaxID=1748220 RepID=UPI0012980DD8|nr:Trp biosynthesis-associated membrane protein [Ornithinicoccus halotolerans]